MKLMASIGALAKVCGMKHKDMKDFLERAKGIEYVSKKFYDEKESRHVEYKAYEVAKVVLSIEAYKNMTSKEQAKIVSDAVALAEDELAQIYGGGLQSGEYEVMP